MNDEQIIEIGKRHFREGHNPAAIPAFVAAVREVLSASIADTAGAKAIRDAVGVVLEGFTLPHAVRKILETAYYAALPALSVADAAGASEDARDAARYRWLRSATYDKAMPAMFDYDRSAHRYLGIRRSTEHLDEAIDAAIAKESGK